jgi:protein-ribulosamine 3-kinase
MLASIRRFSAVTGRFNNMAIDSAIAKLLSLDPKQTTISSAGGGSSFASTSKITTKLSDGTEKQLFMKTGSGSEASVMFEGNNFQPSQ